jgi:site-specific DNA-methyltransferase (adenine-specific)
VREKVYHIFGQGFPKSKSMRDIGRPELGSALKPAVEEWILVRKPLSEPSIAANVLKHGVGGINVDVCRVATDWATDPTRRGWQGGNTSPDFDGGVAPIHVADTPGHKRVSQPNNQGRFPSHLLLSHHPACVRRGEKRVKGGNDPRRANGSKGGVSFHGYVHDERPCNHAGYADADGRELVADWECDAACPVRQLDEQAGVRKSGARKGPNPNATKALADAYAGGWKQTGGPCDASEGTVSRFFTVFEPDPDALFVYMSKASRRDREQGLEGRTPSFMATMNDGIGARPHNPDQPSAWVKNTHPTAKSTALGKWLTKLIAPPGGTVLDMFCGSGSLGVAAVLEGYTWIGIDESAEYIAIARARLEWAANQRPKAEQLTLTV